MPDGINGRQLAVKIDNRRPGGPVVYMSGYPENVIIRRLDRGCLAQQAVPEDPCFLRLLRVSSRTSLPMRQ